MTKVRTLSRTFLKGHPKAGQPTYFVEKVYNSIFHKNNLMDYPKGLEVDDSIRTLKHHTIRMGRHFKPQDKLSLAVWSGKPYRSKQIKIWEGDIRVINISIHSTEKGLRFINDDSLAVFEQIGSFGLAHNDGLSYQDFLDWFKLPIGVHEAQILIWGNVGY